VAGLVVLASALVLTGCPNLTDGGSDITYTAEQVGGSSNETTSTSIKLTFSAALTGLTDGDISVNTDTGAVIKGELTGGGPIWHLALDSVTRQGYVAVSISKSGIENAVKTVVVYKKAAATDADSEAADSFRNTYSAILAKTTDNVVISDKETVQAALTAYNGLTDAVKSLLTTENALLDALSAKIAYLEAVENADPVDIERADVFRSAHEAILAKTTANVTTGDKAAVQAALAAYDNLSPEVKVLLPFEKVRLDSLLSRITQIETAAANQAAANTFKTTHTTALALTVDTVAIGDKTAVQAALADYNGLTSAVKALLSAEKTLLDKLLNKINQFSGVKITFSGLTQDEEITLPDTDTASWTENTTISFTVDATFTVSAWYVDGNRVPDTATNTLSFTARDYAPGTHVVTVKVSKESEAYTKTATFRIEE
jgi:predicted small secreted protein